MATTNNPEHDSGGSLAEALRKVAPGTETVFDVLREVDADGPRVRVEFSNKRSEKERLESPRRKHEFHDIPGLCRYLAEFKTPHTVVYVDVPNQKFHIVLSELATAGFEVLTFAPQVHPRWAPWEAVLGKRFELPALVDFLRENRRAVEKPNARDLVLALSQVKASTEITLHQGKGNRSLNGLLVRTTVQGTKKDEIVELPESLSVRMPIFVSTAPVAVELDLLLGAERNFSGVVARLSAVDLRDAMLGAFQEMVSDFAEALKEKDSEKGEQDITVVYGRPGYSNWSYQE